MSENDPKHLSLIHPRECDHRKRNLRSEEEARNRVTILSPSWETSEKVSMNTLAPARAIGQQFKKTLDPNLVSDKQKVVNEVIVS